MKLKFFVLYISILFFGCEGPQGEIGPQGLNSLLNLVDEAPGDNCEYGGIKVESGIDLNANGMLEVDEVATTKFVCSIPGLSSLQNIIDLSAGEECINGGFKIQIGIDSNSNNILDAEEIQEERLICNGLDGRLDEQIRLNFEEDEGCSGVGGSEKFFRGRLDNFNIDYYSEVDSAVLLVYSVRSNNSSFSAFIELYDKTNDQSIENSSISIESEARVDVSSSNFVNNLPSGEVDLTINLKAELGTTLSVCEEAYILLYRSY